MNRIATTSRSPRGPTPAAATDRGHRLLYRHSGIVITVETLQVGGRRYAIAELTDLRTARGPYDPVLLRVVALSGASVVAVAAAVGVHQPPTQLGVAGYLTLLVGGFLPMTVAAVGSRLRPRPFELWAEHRGQSTLLYRAPDERHYGQVTRALLRAVEAQRLGGVAPPVAAFDPWGYVRG